MLAGGIPASQVLADRLIAAGHAGMLVRSFVTGASVDDINLVILPSPAEVEVLDVGSREVPCPGLAPSFMPRRRWQPGGEETRVDAWIVRALREVVARAPDSFRGEESVEVCRLVYG